MKTNKRDRPFYGLLPELYRKDKLLDEIVAVFEEQYLKIEKTIDALPDTLYDPSGTKEEYIEFLWDMFGLKTCADVFSSRQKRELLPLVYVLQRWKGTRKALDWLLRAFISDLCGYWVSPVIMEYDSWADYECSASVKDMYRKRFGGEEHFTVFIPPEPPLLAPGVKERIEVLLEEYSPADAVFHLVMANPQPALGVDFHLGFSHL